MCIANTATHHEKENPCHDCFHTVRFKSKGKRKPAPQGMGAMQASKIYYFRLNNLDIKYPNKKDNTHKIIQNSVPGTVSKNIIKVDFTLYANKQQSGMPLGDL